QQYPSRLSAIPGGQGSKLLVEVAFQQDDPAYTKALNNGIVVESRKLRLLPNLALSAKENEANIIRVSLSKIPSLPEPRILSGLKETMAPYGKILDLGICYEPTTQTFNGSGYAIMYLTDDKTKQLNHNIPWRGTEYGLYGIWSKMPRFCRYCHKGDHVVTECPSSRRSISCYNCGDIGHLAAMCPRGNYGKRTQK
ncbi:hypothetical protein BC941DRAFT_340923, partial [Chlamydoabsidia padenii]